MLRKHFWKLLLVLLALLFLGYWFFADNVLLKVPEKTLVSQQDQYSIWQSGGQYYLRIRYPENLTPDYISSNIPDTQTKPYFDSLAHMKESILSGQLQQWHLNYLWDSCRYDPHYDLIINDLSCIYEPVVDDRLSVSSVHWTGLDYTVIYNITQDQGGISFTCYGNKISFDPVYEREYEMLLQRIEGDLVSKEAISGQNATEYIYYQDLFERTLSKARVFDFSTDTRRLTVLEEYFDSTDALPDKIRFYGCENGVYFSGYLSQAYIEANYDQFPYILQQLHLSSEPIQ